MALYLILLCIPLLVLALSPVSEFLAWSRRSATRSSAEVPPASPALLFLVPAHNEEALIGACVRSLLAMRYPGQAQVVVIADNCTDRTADVARVAGARCLERTDPQWPGKPRALAWALERLRGEPGSEWQACVVIDADSEVDADFAARLATHAPLEDRCVQAYFDVSNLDESWLTRLGGLLARVRYEGSYPLKRAAGLNCPLTGNGMCIGRNLLTRGWPAFSLTENWELYALFTSLGIPIEYEPGARLFSQEAGTLAQARTQRRRWLAGRLYVLRRYSGPLVRSSSIGPHQKLDALGELATPSPVLHATFVLLLVFLATLLLPPWWAATFGIVSAATLVPLSLHTAKALATEPDRWRILGSFLLLPAYGIWRMAMAVLTIGTIRRGEWKKTERQ